MRNVDPQLLGGKMDESVTHYITSHHPNEPVHVDSNGLTLNVQDDGGGRVVTVMHPHNFSSNMCRQLAGEQVVETAWGEELLDTDGRLAALVAHLAQNSHARPPHHMKVTSVRSDVDPSVILDTPLRLFNGQNLEHPPDSSLVVEVPPLPPLQDMKRCADSDWFHNKTKTILKDGSPIMTEAENSVLELAAASSPAHIKQNKKSLPHKKRISRKLRRNNGGSTPQQDIVVINCSEEVPQEILPDSFSSVQHQQHLPAEAHHIEHEMRAIFICQICGEFYGEEQLKFFHHLKQHYEPHSTIIIENPVSELAMDKMTNTCIVDSVATLPDSIVELSLENTVPKTIYQPIEKHILYTSSDKSITYQSKSHYSVANMDKETTMPSGEVEKSDLYETLDKLEMYSCVKCNKSFRKQKQCEAHIKEAHSNGKLDDMGEFSEPEDLMEGIHVAVEEAGSPYEQTLLPHLTVDNGHVHQDHARHWYNRNGSSNGSVPPPDEVGGGAGRGEDSDSVGPAGAGPGGAAGAAGAAGAGQAEACGAECAYCVVCAGGRPAHESPHLKEEVLQRIFEAEVSNEEANFPETIIPDNNSLEEPEPPPPPPPVDEDKSAGNKKKAAKQFSCLQCSRVFQHRNSLLYHVLSHSGKQHPCQQCGKEFYTVTALKIHERVHSGDRPCKCEECGREFRQWSDLKYHKISIHSNQKHFKCEFCGKEFARKYSLNIHRKIHTGERNYQCHYCSKSFRASSYRLSHMRTHTGARPYKCVECDKSFRAAGDLRRHALIHNRHRNRQNEKLQKLADYEPAEKPKVKNEQPTQKPSKKIAVASTTRLPSILKTGEKKTPAKKTNAKKPPPNVTVSQNRTAGLLKVTEYNNTFFEMRQEEQYTKFKEIYSENPGTEFIKVKDYSEQIVYKDSEQLSEGRELIFRNGQLCDVQKTFRENTDGKMHVFTHVEKSKEYSGPVVTNTVSLNELRTLDREVGRERADGLHGEQNENAFLEKLAALYNITT